MRDLSCSSSCKVWKEQHDQYDLRYRLLSLLLHLADSPVNNVYEPPAPLDEEREAQVDLKLHSFAVSIGSLNYISLQVDWFALLREGEDEPESWGDDDTLSDWSEEDDQEQDDGASLKTNQHRDQFHAQSSGEEEESKDSWFDDRISAAHNWVTSHKEDLRPVENPHLVARLSNIVEDQLEAAGGLGLRSQRTTEYQVHFPTLSSKVYHV